MRRSELQIRKAQYKHILASVLSIPKLVRARHEALASFGIGTLGAKGAILVQGLFLEDLTEGQSAEMTHVATAEVVEAFAQVSGDGNPLHLDEAYAKTTSFGQRI